LTDRLRLMANSSNEGWSKFGAELSLLGSGIDDNDWRQQAPIVSCRTSVCGCAILHRTGAKAFVPAQRLEVVHCANRRRRTRGWLTGRAPASIGRCVANSVQNATHSPVVRERIIVARPAYVPLPVLPLPRYGLCRGASRRYGLVSETENTCRGKDGRLHLAAFFPAIYISELG
jgi:hypothetical protein